MMISLVLFSSIKSEIKLKINLSNFHSQNSLKFQLKVEKEKNLIFAMHKLMNAGFEKNNNSDNHIAHHFYNLFTSLLLEIEQSNIEISSISCETPKFY